MLYSYELDLRILFKKFYCPKCGERLNARMDKTKMTDEQKERYYKELYPHGIPMNIDVGEAKQVMTCPGCDYLNTTDGQLAIRKIQKKLKKIIPCPLPANRTTSPAFAMRTAFFTASVRSVMISWGFVLSKCSIMSAIMASGSSWLGLSEVMME